MKQLIQEVTVKCKEVGEITTKEDYLRLIQIPDECVDAIKNLLKEYGGTKTAISCLGKQFAGNLQSQDRMSFIFRIQGENISCYVFQMPGPGICHRQKRKVRNLTASPGNGFFKS